MALRRCRLSTLLEGFGSEKPCAPKAIRRARSTGIDVIGQHYKHGQRFTPLSGDYLLISVPFESAFFGLRFLRSIIWASKRKAHP